MIFALRRVAQVPILVVALWCCELVVAAGLGALVALAARAAMGPHAFLDAGEMLADIVVLLAVERSLGTQLVLPVVIAGVLGAVFWTAASGGIIAKLARPREIGVFVAVGQWLPAMAIVSAWHFLVRATLLCAVVIATLPVPRGVAVPVIAIVWGVCTFALDLARAQIVLHDAPRYHVRTALIGFVGAVQHPRWLGQSLALNLVQWGCVSIVAYMGVSGMDDGSGVLAARILAFPVVVLGLWRVAVAVEAPPIRSRTRA